MKQHNCWTFGIRLTLTIAFALFGGSARAVEQLDQSWLPGGWSCQVGMSEQYNVSVAQIYTAGLTGTLAEIRVAAFANPPDLTITAEIHDVTLDGKPGSVVLGTTTFVGSMVWPALNSAIFPDPIDQVAGVNYAIVLSTPISGSWVSGSGIGSPIYNTGSGALWNNTIDGAWEQICGSPLYFQTYVDVMEAAYQFTGFFQPIDNPPTLNVMKAGQAVPIKFSLGGNQGLDIFGSGYPTSQSVSCGAFTAIDAVEEISAAGASTLQYDSGKGQYTYVWKTSSAWANTCRVLILNFNDGTQRTANFHFKK